MSLKICCLMLVDDNEHEAEVTRRKLELSRLEVGEVVMATSLAQALSVVTRRMVDIILLDLDLGDSKSLDTLRALRAVTDTVIIVLSQDEDELLGIESLKAGADDFLVKSKVTGPALRTSIVHSMTRHNIRTTARRMKGKLDQLCQMAGV